MSKSHFFLPLPVCGSLQFCLAGSSRMSSLPFKVKDRFFCSLFEIASVTCTRASYVELASKFSINEDASCTCNIRNSLTTGHKWRRMDSPPQSPPGYSGGWHQPLLSSTRHHQPGEEQAYSEDGSNFCLPVNMQKQSLGVAHVAREMHLLFLLSVVLSVFLIGKQCGEKMSPFCRAE